MRKALTMSYLLTHAPTLTNVEWQHAEQFVAVGEPIRQAIDDVSSLTHCSFPHRCRLLQLQANDALLSETWLMVGGLREQIASAMHTGEVAQALGQHALDELDGRYRDPVCDPKNLYARY
jgi:hypothetical protein